MLRFEVYRNGAPTGAIDLSGAYAFGQDGIPVRADLAVDGSQITCSKHVPGACGVALLWDAGDSGHFMLHTCRLPDLDRPFNLNVELARAQMMRIAQKQEDWGLFDYADAESLNREFDQVRGQFVEALKTTDPAEAAKLADAALDQGLTLGEKIALYHADIFINRRRAAGGGTVRTIFGCMANLAATEEAYQAHMKEGFDFLSVPVPWKHIEPKERQFKYEQIDAWLNWAARNRRIVHAGPLVSFEATEMPEWLYLWENDYESLREMIYEHIQRTVKRYQRQVQFWKVCGGIHAYNNVNCNFEQIMELTRMSCQLVKKLAPRAQVIIELVLPWSEYYARNQRSIPPLLYADMAVQSGIKFDAFGLQLCMGVPMDGFFVRDFLQVSSLLDEFVAFGKSLHITACQVPSSSESDDRDAWTGEAPVEQAGYWHVPWSQRLQAEWLQAFYRIAASKPYVESICWRDLTDHLNHYIPHGGLCDAELKPKLAYAELRNLRAQFLSAPAVIDQQPRPTPNRKP